MSILIKGMEMPHGCCECRMERENCCTLSLRPIDDIYDRPEWCLLTEAEPVKHGRWIRKDSKRYYWYECSNCGYPPPLDRYKHEWFSEYCPNCGAKMDEVEE